MGTIINFFTLILGGVVGWLVGKKLPEEIRATAFVAIGMSLLGLGITMIVKINNPLFIIVCLLLGGIFGTIVGIDDKLNNLSRKLKDIFKIKEKGVVSGLVTMFLAACVGSLAVLGPINEGISGDMSLLLTKSVLDFFTAITLASSVGIGVVLAAVPLLIYQGLIMIFSSQLKPFVSVELINELNGVGGILILVIGMNLLKVTKIKVANFLPSLLLVALLVMFIK